MHTNTLQWALRRSVLCMSCATAALSPVISHKTSALYVTSHKSLGAAQADSFEVRGVVLSSATGQGLPFAVVSIPALNIERFANDRGQFVLPRLPAGRYKVRARQLGYSPGEIDFTLTATTASTVTIKLARLAYRLSEVKVASDWVCENPGKPTSSAEATEIFEQLEQNADRMRLMAEQYPFVLRGERRQFTERSDGDVRDVHVDTTTIDGGEHQKYRAGEMVYSTSASRAAREYYLQLPTLLDFADDDFQRNHCFVVRGVDKTDSLHRVRIDFKASRKIRKADVEGSVYLDSATFQLRSTELRMTRIPNEIRGVQAVRVSAQFHEARAGLPVLAGVRAVTDLVPVRSKAGNFQAIEVQRPLELVFLRQRPDSSTR